MGLKAISPKELRFQINARLSAAQGNCKIARDRSVAKDYEQPNNAYDLAYYEGKVDAYEDIYQLISITKITTDPSYANYGENGDCGSADKR